MDTDILRTRCRWYRLAIIALLPLVTILAVEMVARLSFTTALHWITLSDSVNTLRFTYLWVAMCVMALYTVLNRLRLAALLCLLALLIFAAIHAGKEAILQQPLLPGDFALIGMIAHIWSSTYFPFTWAQVGAATLIVGCGVAFCRWGLPDWRLSHRQRLILGPAALVLLVGLSTQTRLLASREVPLERKLTVTWSAENNLPLGKQAIPAIQNPDFSVSINYRSFGLIPGFLLYFDKRELEGGYRPHNYSVAAVRQVWSNSPSAKPEATTLVDTDERPHVIVVLSESFWDPRWLEGVTIDPDPLSTYHKLALESNGCPFTSVSPVFGGYTCNAEFEALTGMSIAVLPPHVVPHTGFFKGSIPSLPATFKANGYRTAAIHPFLPEFWNRNLIYPLIGFDRFIDIGTMTHREVRGKFIGDNAVADEILDTLAAETTPAFIFAITIQNHSPYGDGRYGDVETETVQVESPTISAASVRDYVHGIRDSDAMLEKLTRRLAASDRRVLLVFFGDHQPSLIPYESELGLFTQGIRADAGPAGLTIGRKYMGPAFFWVNRGKAPTAPSAPLSLAALPTWILREAGVPLPPFFRLSEQVFSRYPVLHQGWAVTADGKQTALRPPFTDPLLRDYHMIAYDLLLGKNYSRQVLADGEDRLRRRSAK